MGRYYSLVALFLALGMLALSVPVAHGALAKDSGDKLCSTPTVADSVVSNDKTYVPVETIDVGLSSEDYATPASHTEQAEPVIANELHVEQAPILSETEASRLRILL